VVVAQNRVLTNAHNLRDRTTSVSFGDGREVQASAVGVDVDGDLAVLEVDTGEVVPLTWGDPGEAAPGRLVYAAARSRSGVRTTVGLVTATEQDLRGPRGRRITGSIEHTAPLPRGSSGGPVLDREGRLLGLNTRRLGEGFYSALPADEALRARVESLAAGEAPSRRRLGLVLAPAAVATRLRAAVGLPERDGLLVRAVEDDSPAAGAGVRAGDLLVAAGGRPLADADVLHEVLDGLADGATLELLVVRGADELAIGVTFPEAPPTPPQT
jgi:S1-C subfamily serine protease